MSRRNVAVVALVCAAFVVLVARSGDEVDWRAFENAVAVTLGDRAARLELERAVPDMDVVRQGFDQEGAR